MKKVLLLLVAAFVGVFASAQKVYFLYLQTDDQTPFYVRMGSKIHSSASSGFLILPNLTDSTYNLSVGFSKSSEPEVKFTIPINQDDKGFIIKKFEDGLALFDFKDLSIVKSASTQKDNTVYETKSDNFSNILSKAAGDPSIVKVPVVKKEEGAKSIKEKKEAVTAKVEESKPVEKTTIETAASTPTETVAEPKVTQEDTTVNTTVNNLPVVTTQAPKQEVKETVATPEPLPTKEETIVERVVYKPSVVSRRSESSTTEGFGITYHDKSEQGIDTIRILIPASKIKLVSETESSASVDVQTKVEKADPLPVEKSHETANSVQKSNSDELTENTVACKGTASEKDFLKLRKKMVAKDNDEAMIEEARKEFKNKCFSVEQIRYLSTLFLTSAAKYQFFDAAFERVSDKANFASLGTEIKDDYYAKRFKALIGE